MPLPIEHVDGIVGDGIDKTLEALVIAHRLLASLRNVHSEIPQTALACALISAFGDKPT
jgi:hypothetical protein